jgi:ABC-2 type transport system ATP-binding protein
MTEIITALPNNPKVVNRYLGFWNAATPERRQRLAAESFAKNLLCHVSSGVIRGWQPFAHRQSGCALMIRGLPERHRDRARQHSPVTSLATTKGIIMTASNSYAVEASGLVKSFDGTRAVDGIDLAIPEGGVVGILGPNGAGKTTTVRMLATLLRPDAGTARIFGHDVTRAPEKVRGLISLTGQFASIDDDLSGLDNLRIQARLRGLSRRAANTRADELVDGLELVEAARRPVKTYSGGMRRRLDIAASLVVAPRLLFLDEPTTGLDPRSRGQVWDLIRDLVRQGSSVLLTTQYLEEADRLADRIVVIDHGRVVADDTAAHLKRAVGTGVLEVETSGPSDAVRAAQLLGTALGAAAQIAEDGITVRIHIPDGGSLGRRVTSALAQLPTAGVEVSSFALGLPSLDEVFLELTGHTATAMATTTDSDTEAREIQ